MTHALEQLRHRLHDHLQLIYRDIPLDCTPQLLADELIHLMRLQKVAESPAQNRNHWDQKDAVVITYGDTLLHDGTPLQTLLHFLDEHTQDCINSVHILPFFPFSSDHGFAVIDFSSVNESLGGWQDIQEIAARYRLMADVVINHCSSRGVWFQNFIKQQDPGKDYFFTASPDDDLSQVIRPRTNPLLREVETAAGTKHVWCTFSHDQVDLDFRNPEVLKQFVGIMRLYLDKGVRIFRLDAVAFLWKEVGTSCLNLPQTHEIVRLLRTLVEHAQHDAVIITETNIPNRENLAYFGNNNEAHWIYNFSLPPLLVNALITGSSHYLNQWLMAMPPARDGTTYFNFIASHDGIGLRPLEGLLTDEEELRLIETMQAFGGFVSWRALEGGVNKPYEVNIALYDALKGTTKGPDAWNMQRFVCAHAIMMGLEGIPAFYIHSLLATGNDYKRVENTGRNRSINRHQWDFKALERALADYDSRHARVFTTLRGLLKIRAGQPAFHPNAMQVVLHLGDGVFAFMRQCRDQRQTIFCLSNISDQPQTLPMTSINLATTERYHDLVSDQIIDPLAESIELAPYQTMWISTAR